MAETLDFHGWTRSGVFDLAAGAAVTDGRLTGGVTLTLRDELAPSDAASEVARFDIIAPGDVSGLRPGAVARVHPSAGAPDAEREKAAYVELAAEDLPWRYSTFLAAGPALRPWLVLVVARAGTTEAELNAGGQVTLAGDALTTHDLNASARWAHVQADPSRPHAPRLARLLSPRVLAPTTAYLAVLVPAITATGAPAWTPGTASVTLPAYHHWEFATADAGDFPTLAGRLAPASGGDLGRAPLTYGPLEVGGLSARGALMPVGVPDTPVPPAVTADVAALTAPVLDPRRPAVTLPDYGAAWVASPVDTTWGAVFHADPRHRGVAGLGLMVGIAEQEHLADAAAEQAGALAAAAQRIRQLVAGLGAAQAVWRRRLPTDALRRLAVFGPALRRMMTTTGSVRDRITEQGRPLPAALFSSAARRVLRPGTVRGRRLARGAADPAAVIKAGNVCRPLPDRVVDGLPHADALAEATGTRPLDELITEAVGTGSAPFPDLPRLVDAFDRSGYSPNTLELFDGIMHVWVEMAAEGGDVPVHDLLTVLDPERRHTDEELRPLLIALRGAEPERPVEGGEDVVTVPPERACRPVDLDTVAETVADAVDPTVERPSVVDQVLDLIDGLEEPVLAPPELCPDLDIPAWAMLRDHAPDWLVPGGLTMPEDRVVALSTNPEFVDAFLLGLNTQTIGELRFRNIPVRTGCTPLRQFWSRADPSTGTYADDIRGIHTWPADSALGSITHQTPQAASADLVVVFRSPLFRRYPRTLVHLTPAPPDGDGDPDWEADPDLAVRLEPTFQGTLTPEITFFGFDLEPALAARHWVVLEEPPHGVQFFSEERPEWDATRRNDFRTGADGGTFAAAAFAEPFRVLLRGSALL
ncbi:hypothetical protein ACFPK1_32255 [Actinomycetospora rhizophila]|uniref:Uncharacterized protein n=1 Tax=Actinomycetospora rhizophila TaxID=1416876 RepID=A0ABV9ZU30_9PSEU